MECQVLNKDGKVVSKVKLNQSVFDGRVNMALLYQSVNSYLNNKRSQRLAAVKTRAQVSGSGKKPWRQKGTGRARVGELRNPLWRKGGIVFGPKVRRVYRKIPHKMKRAALKSALNAKYNDKELVIMDKLQLDSPKTKELAAIIKKLGFTKRVLFVDKEFSKNCFLSSRNLEVVELERASDLNAYHALNCKNLVLTEEALKILEEKILKSKKPDLKNQAAK
ncbi:MAG: 50S ribosomal protein L4 [Candidatus Omnitrophica bacterium]|nr:50S ribosomal protein L4 [Candidatus Omnitrophota bacterium]